MLRFDNNTHSISVVPYIVGIDIEVVSFIGTDGQMVMIALEEDEMHFSGERTLLLIVLEVDIAEFDAHLHFLAGFEALELFLLHFPFGNYRYSALFS